MDHPPPFTITQEPTYVFVPHSGLEMCWWSSSETGCHEYLSIKTSEGQFPSLAQLTTSVQIEMAVKNLSEKFLFYLCSRGDAWFMR